MWFSQNKRSQAKLSQIKFSDLHKLRNAFTDTPGVRKLDQRADITPVLSDEYVFRTHAAAETDFLACQTSMPRRHCKAPNVKKHWEDITNAEAQIMEGGSLFIEGVAGTGKSTLAQGIIERMRSLGKKCLAISKTHVASSKI